jgi:AsmA protein
LKALRAVDLDLALSVPEVKFGQLPLANARVKARLDNGELAADIDRITIGAGNGAGTISLKARGTSYEAALALKLQDVDAEPITTELSGRPLLKGTSTVDITTRTSGRSPAEFVATLDGNARVEMKKGQLRGWDLGEMVAQLWNYKGWGYTPSRSTPVDQLTATYTMKSGTVTSAPDLTMKGPTAGIRSVGNVVVPRRLIDQNVDVQNLFFNIVIKGDWTKKLWIGPAFLGGLKPAPGAALEADAPPAAALPKALPADLSVRIERILSDPGASSRLTAAQKKFLNALVSADRPGT